MAIDVDVELVPGRKLSSALLDLAATRKPGGHRPNRLLVTKAVREAKVINDVVFGSSSLRGAFPANYCQFDPEAVRAVAHQIIAVGDLSPDVGQGTTIINMVAKAAERLAESDRWCCPIT